MANKLKIFTFNSGVRVYGREMDGVMYPLEFRSEVACEKFSYKFFMKNIYMTPIRSFTDPKKFYLKILDEL